MTKASYRNNPAVRERAIARAAEYARQADPLRRRRIRLSKRVYNLREYIAAHLEKVRLLERRLMDSVRELERVKREIGGQHGRRG